MPGGKAVPDVRPSPKDNEKDGLLQCGGFPVFPPAWVANVTAPGVLATMNGWAGWEEAEFEDSTLPVPNGFDYFSPQAPKAPLFEFVPDFPDVQQGMIGDCYLLAALNTLLRRKGAAAIYEMIKAEDDFVIVRFFYDKRPRFIKVERSIMFSDDGQGNASDVQSHAAVWPYYIEKAYALFRKYFLFGTVGVELWPNGAVPMDYITTISGGSPGDAFSHMVRDPRLSLSEFSETVRLKGVKDPDEWRLSEYRSALLRSALVDQVKWLDDSWEAVFQKFLGMGGHASAASIQDLQKYIQDTYRNHKAAVEKCIDLIDLKIFNRDEMRRGEIDALLSAIPREAARSGKIATTLKNVIKTFVDKSFPGKRGSALYTDYQEDLFKQLQAGGWSGAFAGTRTIIGNEGKWILSKEDVNGLRKGLLPGHAYEIIGVQEVQSAANPTKPLRYVYIKNPWFKTVREYAIANKNLAGGGSKIVLTAKTADQHSVDIGRISAEIRGEANIPAANVPALTAADMGKFPIELSDLTKFFENVELVSEGP